MSGVVPPQNGQPADEELEELGDDVIIAQETKAHVPQPRAAVKQEQESVVISEYPAPSSGVSSRRRGRAEATVVIRDRRKIEEMRRAIAQQRDTVRPNRRLYLWAGAAIAAFVLGGVVALVASGGTANGAAATTTSIPEPTAAPKRVEAVEAPKVEAPKPVEPAPVVIDADEAAPAPAPTSDAPEAVELDDLPVERPKRR